MSRQSLLAEARNKRLLASAARKLVGQFQDKGYIRSLLQHAQEVEDEARHLEADAAELPVPFAFRLWHKLIGCGEAFVAGKAPPKRG
jgi:hypothetical protein